MMKSFPLRVGAAAAFVVLSSATSSSAARIVFPSPTQRVHPSLFASVVIAQFIAVVSSSSEGVVHDFDDSIPDENDDHLSGASEGSSEPSNQPLTPARDEYTESNRVINVATVIDRFSRVIANEIIRRLPPAPMLLQFRPPWRENTSKQKPQMNSVKGEQSNNDDDPANVREGAANYAIDIQRKRRVGGWCPPDEDSGQGDVEDGSAMIDKSVVACSPDASSSVGIGDSCHYVDEERRKAHVMSDDVEAGMVVYVFAQEKVDLEEEPPSGGIFNSLEGSGDAGSDKGSIRGMRCLHEMGQHYDNDEQVIQYTLLKREPVELGNVDAYRKDFAYQPVVLTIDSGMYDSSATTHGHELETRIKPEDEAIVTVVSKRNQQSHWHDEVGDDQQVSFRWFSWVSHISQMLHRGREYDSGITHMDSDVVISSSSETPYQSNIYEEDGRRPFAGGSHGEIWRARRRCPMTGDETDNSTSKFASCDEKKDLIVKRLKIEFGYEILEAGLREVYFGELLAREAEAPNLFTTYVDHFFREGQKPGQVELWIVFENAGPSLRSFLYQAVDTGGFVVFQNSAFWRRLRRSIAGAKGCKGCDDDEALELYSPRSSQTEDHNEERKHTHTSTTGSGGNVPEGRVLLREVLKQIVTSVAFLHERGILHRDIKPSNVMCTTTPQTKIGHIPRNIQSVRCLLGDFSSAYDEFSGRNLYVNGPSSKEQTDEYAPPEVLLGGNPFFPENPSSFDSWSIGVVALEMLLGTPNVFSVDQRTTVLLTSRLKKEGASSHDTQRALYLAALSQFCIYAPTLSSLNWIPGWQSNPLQGINVVKNKCTIKDFHSALRARDPLGIGFDDDANVLLHLVWRLLDWNPLERLSASEALEHPYFTSIDSANTEWNLNPIFLHNRLFRDTTSVIARSQENALEHQTLDPSVDISSDRAMPSNFVCPKCGKKFSDLNSCQRHARSRKHARFCAYDRSLLPQCLNAHSMLPTHSTSGYCDIQGRRKTIEDFHTIHLHPVLGHQFYGVFDGHLGNLASKYAASSFYRTIEHLLSNVDDSIEADESSRQWQKGVELKLMRSFEDLHHGIIEAVNTSPGGIMDESGTTATIVYVTQLAVIVANVGDSRAVLSRWIVDEEELGHSHITALQLTVDHVASSTEERAQVIERGGFVSESGGIDRVNGSLAVSRSLGDVKLAPFLSRTPHVLALTREEVYAKCSSDEIAKHNGPSPCFIILASDGLWDVISNQEAVDLAWQVIGGNDSGTAYQEAAEVLTQEAYVRGSTDNIGVCVVAIV